MKTTPHFQVGIAAFEEAALFMGEAPRRSRRTSIRN
jgi:hypothetical protein